jgi:ankyrin repeat protein
VACYDGHVQVVVELLGHGADIESKDNTGNTPLHRASGEDHLLVVKALLSSGADLLAANNQGKLPIHRAVYRGNSEVSKCLLQWLYATTRRLPLHVLVEDLTWIGNPYSMDAPPLRAALQTTVLGTDDVVHVACRRGASFSIVQSLVNHDEASVKSVTSEGDLPLFLACDIPKPSLDTIFTLVKLYPDLVYR